ncbi:MAG: hypothetical protein DRI57_27680 [Deltaproteobacteria bacterium]|nr:MAG: hypothetical protein DRI57_27680 [Deltaproteobacteria bacterium]
MPPISHTETQRKGSEGCVKFYARALMPGFRTELPVSDPVISAGCTLPEYVIISIYFIARQWKVIMQMVESHVLHSCDALSNLKKKIDPISKLMYDFLIFDAV